MSIESYGIIPNSKQVVNELVALMTFIGWFILLVTYVKFYFMSAANLNIRGLFGVKRRFQFANRVKLGTLKVQLIMTNGISSCSLLKPRALK